MTTSIKAIETRYAGCRFRSRLEARWAVFFDACHISWQYEPQGFDFHLPECGTWVEVKGVETDLDKPFLLRAGATLPFITNGHGERGPRLMVLGPIPDPPPEGDIGWIGIDEYEGETTVSRCGFGTYAKNNRPWWLSGASRDENWLTPSQDEHEWSASGEYLAARSARFEHGERG